MLTNSPLEPKMRGKGGGELRGLSQWVQWYTGAQINFGDLTPYLTYGYSACHKGHNTLLNLKHFFYLQQSLRFWILESIKVKLIKEGRAQSINVRQFKFTPGCAQQHSEVPHFTRGYFLVFFMYIIQHCFICRPSESTVSEDAGIEPWTVANLTLAVRRFYHSARSHPQVQHSTPKLQGTTAENSKKKQIFPEKELLGHSPNFHIHVSVSDLYPRRSPYSGAGNMWSNPGNI